MHPLNQHTGVDKIERSGLSKGRPVSLRVADSEDAVLGNRSMGLGIYGGEIDAEDLGGGVLASEVKGPDARAGAYVQN